MQAQMTDEFYAEQAPPSGPPTPRGSRFRRWLLDVLETVLPALLIVVVVNLFLAQATRVEGQSMEPNIHHNQRLVVEKVSYHFRLPERGEIVVLKPTDWTSPGLDERILDWLCTALPIECERLCTRLGIGCEADMRDPLIKRVIGLPGETIEIRDGYVYIDGMTIEEPYVEQLTFGNISPRVISPDHVFVLGDNRGASNDSRSFGEVALSNIIGRAWVRYWPFDDLGLVR
jgi:signal peptidase I